MAASDAKPGTPSTLESAPDRAPAATQPSGVARTERAEESKTDPAKPSAAAVTIAADRPRIEDDGVIGRGGMGAVHRVYDRNLRRFSAMKVMDAAHAKEPNARRRFVAEGQITGQLEHPHVVPVYDFEPGEEDQPPRFTMKLVEGETLAAMVRRGRVAARTESELWDLLDVFLKVCEAVAYAHSRGVVHRDLKPENIMIGGYGQVYVMDWGIARLVDATPVLDAPPADSEAGVAPRPRRAVSVDADTAVEPHGTVIGTPQYMAPEQAWGNIQDIDARTDVFALGAILYHILTGRPPYRGSSPPEVIRAARAAKIQPPAEVAENGQVSPALAEIAMKAMRPAREERYQTVESLKWAVERAVRGGLWLGTTTFPAGAVILREGEPPDAAYIIVKGRAAAYRSEQGEQRQLRVMGPGDVFGEMALLSDRPRSASVMAVDAVTAIVVTKEMLAREVPSESWLLPLLRTLVDRFRELEDATKR